MTPDEERATIRKCIDLLGDKVRQAARPGG
jgi:hypothetical protein